MALMVPGKKNIPLAGVCRSAPSSVRFPRTVHTVPGVSLILFPCRRISFIATSVTVTTVTIPQNPKKVKPAARSHPKAEYAPVKVLLNLDKRKTIPYNRIFGITHIIKEIPESKV